jgi:ferredoxin
VNSECSGQTSTSKIEENIQKAWKVINSNGHLTVREVAEEAGISKTMGNIMLTENLDVHHVAAKFVCHTCRMKIRNKIILM